MTRVGEGVECIEVGNKVGAERIEVDIPDQLEEVGLLFNGFVAVLKEMARPFVAETAYPVRRRLMTSDKGVCPEKDMGMIRKKRERIATALCFGKHLAGAVDEPVPVYVVKEDIIPRHASHHEMMNCARGIDAVRVEA